MSSQVGDTNRNNQKLLAKTNSPGTDNRQYVWVVECQSISNDEVCGHRYGVNGTDFFQRLCPKCQRGQPGLPIAGHRLAK
jgi:hypothetical protein